MESDCERVGRLIDAAVRDQSSAGQMLRSAPELVRLPYRLGETALHFCAVENYPDAVGFLAEHDADVNCRSGFGRTPLMDAAWIGLGEVVRALLDHGADVNAVDRYGESPLHFAVKGGVPEVVELLLKAGADPMVRSQVGEQPGDYLPEDPLIRQVISDLLRQFGGVN